MTGKASALISILFKLLNAIALTILLVSAIPFSIMEASFPTLSSTIELNIFALTFEFVFFLKMDI